MATVIETEHLTKRYGSAVGIAEGRDAHTSHGAQLASYAAGCDHIQAEMFSLIAPLALGYLVIRTITGPTIGAEERGYLDTGSIAPNLSRSFVGLTAVATVMMAMGAGLLERRDILH